MIPFTATREKLLGIFLPFRRIFQKTKTAACARWHLPGRAPLDAVANGEFPSGKVA